MKYKQWHIHIGVETHAQIITKSKIFSSSCSYYNNDPNTQINEIDLGIPGTLPKLNKKVINKAIKFGLIINSKISNKIIFNRKNYFYPDLPKGYQITQFNYPILKGGFILCTYKINNNIFYKKIKIIQTHLEEDAGKLIHNKKFNKTFIDYNRAGVGLLEIISEPCMSNIYEVLSYIKNLKNILLWHNICNCNMENGNLRFDINISISKSKKILGKKCEIKNLNSFKNIKYAIIYEIERQINILKFNNIILEETRLYDSKNKKTYYMRNKENKYDYLYIFEPNLPIYKINKNFIKKIKKKIKYNYQDINTILLHKYGLYYEVIDNLLKYKEETLFFIKIMKYLKIKYSNLIAKLLINEIIPLKIKYKELNEKISILNFIYLLKLFIKKKISIKNIRKIIENIVNKNTNFDFLVNKYILNDNKDNKDNLFIDKINIIKKILYKKNNEILINKLKLGKEKIINVLVGNIIKELKFKIKPIDIKNIIYNIIKL